MSKLEDKKKIEKEVFGNSFLVIFIHFLYSYIGRNLLSNKKFKIFFMSKIYNVKYEEVLKKANLKVLPEEYFMWVFLSLIFLFFLEFVAIIFFFFVNPIISALIFYGGIFILIIIGLLMYNYPVVLAKDRGDQIDASMPYLLPYMKILSKEINLSKILEIIDDFLIYKEIKIEFRKIKYYSEFLGYDIHSSIREVMLSCPSRELADLMNDLVTISNSGGDIYSYLDRKLSNLNVEIEAFEKKNIETLLIFSQIYVVVLLISPLFYTIMSSILNLIEYSGSTSGGGSNDTVLSIVILLVVLPFVYAGFMILVYYTKPLYSRLEPIFKK